MSAPSTPRTPADLRWALLALSALGFLFLSVFNSVVGDVPVYENAARRLLDGQLPWADFDYEYPPLSLLFTLPPAFFSGSNAYRYVFSTALLCVHVGLGAVLLREGRNHLPGWRALGPFALLTLGGLFLEYMYLKRFDLAPALTCVLAILALHHSRPGSGAAWVALGFGLKLYPLVLLPLVVVRAWRSGRSVAAFAGFAAGTAPLIILGLAGLPWWRVIAFHSGRGLQAESLAGSLLWLAHRLGLAQAEWTWVGKWVEISGPLAPALRVATSAAFVIAVTGSALWSMWSLRAGAAPSLARLSRAALAPLLALLVFSSVLSPQFLIWLVGPAGLSMTDGRWRTALLVLASTALVPLFFPSPDYRTGLGLVAAFALVLRNGLLFVAWVDVLKAVRA